MMSSFQDNAYILPVTQKHLNVQPQNLCHGIGMSKNLHAWSIKPFFAFLPGQNRVYFFHNISYFGAIFVAKNTQSCF